MAYDENLPLLIELTPRTADDRLIVPDMHVWNRDGDEYVVEMVALRSRTNTDWKNSFFWARSITADPDCDVLDELIPSNTYATKEAQVAALLPTQRIRDELKKDAENEEN